MLEPRGPVQACVNFIDRNMCIMIKWVFNLTVFYMYCKKVKYKINDLF